jgi:transmembrane 9 superfamily protein 2/4
VAVARQRADGTLVTSYEHGFRVGFKASYAGVSQDGVLMQLYSQKLHLWILTVYLMWNPVQILQSTEERYFIHNHLSFEVKFHKDSEADSARIVGFEVTPYRYFGNWIQIIRICQLCRG